MNKKHKGKIIVVEGLDGSGKETQSKRLVDNLLMVGHNAVRLDFPQYENGDSVKPVVRYLNGEYEFLKKYMTGMEYAKVVSTLYAADRLSSFIKPNLVYNKSLLELYYEGFIIVLDRYTTSNIICQPVHIIDDHNDDDIMRLVLWIDNYEHNVLGLPKQDMTLFLNVSPEVSIANINARMKGKPNNDIHERLDFQRKMSRVKNVLFENNIPWTNIQCSNDDHTMRDIEDIDSEIFNRVCKTLKLL